MFISITKQLCFIQVLFQDECASNKCSQREECVPMLHGTCLTLYSIDGLIKMPCRRYICGRN